MATKKKAETKTKTKKTTKKPVNTVEFKIDAAIKDMNKKVGAGIVQMGVETVEHEYVRVPFTSPMMNYCTFGGLPVGRLVEFYGPEHGGKTTTAYDIIANYQNMFPNRNILFADAENTYDEEWAGTLGVDSSKIIFIHPDGQSAEEILQIILDMVKNKDLNIGLWVLDSIGALISKKELDDDLDEAAYAGISGPLSRFAKSVQMYMRRNDVLGIAINQERDNIGNPNPYAEPKTPGGRTWKFLCSVRLRFTQGKYLDEKGNELSSNAESPVGMKVMMKIKKNKTCKPTRRIGSYTLNFEEGIDYIKDLVDVAMKYDIITKNGAWFEIVDIFNGDVLADKIQGQSRLFVKLEDDVELLKSVEKLVDKKIQ